MTQAFDGVLGFSERLQVGEQIDRNPLRYGPDRDIAAGVEQLRQEIVRHPAQRAEYIRHVTRRNSDVAPGCRAVDDPRHLVAQYLVALPLFLPQLLPA